jgi:SHS2 domain-containing protein
MKGKDSPEHKPPPFEVLPHTADAALRVFGSDRMELFVNAARGLAVLMEVPDSGEPQVRETLRISASDPIELLVTWLNELLYLSESRHAYWHTFTILELTDTHLEAKIAGTTLTAQTLATMSPVKSATYHDLRIVEEKGWLRTEIVFDL